MATQSLKSLETQIKKLQARALALRQKDRKPAIAAIVQQMKVHKISTAEVAEALETSSGLRRGPARERSAGNDQARKARKAAVAPKYKNPETGVTWSGRGRSPRWILEAEQSGAARDSFKI